MGDENRSCKVVDAAEKQISLAATVSQAKDFVLKARYILRLAENKHRQLLKESRSGR